MDLCFLAENLQVLLVRPLFAARLSPLDLPIMAPSFDTLSEQDLHEEEEEEIDFSGECAETFSDEPLFSN